jgi:hypothetical protein
VARTGEARIHGPHLLHGVMLRCFTLHSDAGG